MTHADELKNSGLKATLPRIKVLEMFQKTSQRHMSAEDVFRVLLADHADVGLHPPAQRRPLRVNAGHGPVEGRGVAHWRRVRSGGQWL